MVEPSTKRNGIPEKSSLIRVAVGGRDLIDDAQNRVSTHPNQTFLRVTAAQSAYVFSVLWLAQLRFLGTL